MKKKVFNRTNILSKRGGTHPIIDPILVIRKSGHIVFSAALVKALSLDKNTIEFVQDDDRPKDWYIEISSGVDSIRLRPTKSQSFYFQSAWLVKMILESMSLPAATYRILVVTEPVEKNLYAILTKSATAPKYKISSKK